MKAVSSNPFARIQETRERATQELSAQDARISAIFNTICTILSQDSTFLNPLKEEGKLGIKIWFSGEPKKELSEEVGFKIQDTSLWDLKDQNLLKEKFKKEFGPLVYLTQIANPVIVQIPHKHDPDDLLLSVKIANIQNLYRFQVNDQGMSFQKLQDDQAPHRDVGETSPFKTMFAEAEQHYNDYSGDPIFAQEVIQTKVFEEKSSPPPFVTGWDAALKKIQEGRSVEYRIVFNTYESESHHTYEFEPRTTNYFKIDESQVDRVSTILNNDGKRYKLIDVAMVVNELAKLCRENGYKWECGFIDKITYTLQSLKPVIDKYKHAKCCTVFSILIPAKLGEKIPEVVPKTTTKPKLTMTRHF